MRLGLVVGKVYTSVAHPTFRRAKLLLVRPLDLDRKPAGRVMLAVDTVDAGEGDIVLVLQEGRSARDHLGDKFAATRTMIVAIIDRLDLAGAA